MEEEKKDVAFEDKHAAENIQKSIEDEKQEEIARYNRNRKIAEFLQNQKVRKFDAWSNWVDTLVEMTFFTPSNPLNLSSRFS